MADEKKNKSGKCEFNDCIMSWILFVLVAGIIVCVLAFIVSDFIRSPWEQDIVIRIEAIDSLKNVPKDKQIYDSGGIDSLIAVVKGYELKLDERYQYLLDKRQEDDRFKTWGALVVSVIVSVCGFWGYKSLRDLREDITETTETKAELLINDYLNHHLSDMVKDVLGTTFKSEIVSVIKAQVFDTLNSVDDPIVKHKVDEKIASDDFENKLAQIVKEKVVEVVNEMSISSGAGINQKQSKHDESMDGDGIQMT